MLIPVPVPVRGEAGQVAMLSGARHRAAAPLRFLFASAGADVAVAHGLGRVPTGWLVIGRSAAVTVYNGSVPSSEDVLVLRATGAAEVDVLPL